MRPKARDARVAAIRVLRVVRRAAVKARTQTMNQLQGLLVTASANMAPFGPDHEVATRVRAAENHLPHLYVNGVGTIGGLRLVGGSRSVDASGTVLAEAAIELLKTLGQRLGHALETAE